MATKFHELYIFANSHDARFSGFTGQHHRDDPDKFMIAWWPDRGDYDLRGYFFCKITVARNCYAKWSRNPSMREKLYRCIDTAKSRLLVYPKLYMEI